MTPLKSITMTRDQSLAAVKDVYHRSKHQRYTANFVRCKYRMAPNSQSFNPKEITNQTINCERTLAPHCLLSAITCFQRHNDSHNYRIKNRKIKRNVISKELRIEVLRISKSMELSQKRARSFLNRLSLHMSRLKVRGGYRLISLNSYYTFPRF